MEFSLKLSSLVLQNFRAFKGYHEIPLSKLNVFVGKNDIGKSSILDAINILLEGEYSSFDKDDICKYKVEDESCIIGGIFSDIPNEMIIDETARTSLSDEKLLQGEDTLFFYYKAKNSATLKPFLKANFPSHNTYKNILDKKLEELKSLATGVITDRDQYQYQANNKASIRKAIREFINDNEGLSLVEQEISIDKEDGKSICDKIKKHLPTYSLFQSDRKNADQDPEAQDPLKTATKEILASMGTELSDIERDVKEYVKKVAERTIEKLTEMNKELAEILEPEFSKPPDWSTVFKYTLKTKDDIPLNKRGSGVRRLILLNFFRAKAEKKLDDELSKQDKLSKNIIYAFEEPETSQHPDYQRLLIRSFIDLSLKENIQIFLTTHSPGVAKLLPPESIYLVKSNGNGVNVLKNDEEILKEVSSELGVLPSIDTEKLNKVKLVVCVEGKNDVQFLQNVNVSIPELKSIIDIADERILIIPLGGSSLQYWVNYDYLGKLNISQIHIYDSDLGHSQKAHQYKKYVDKINERGGKNFACETVMREFENYIHPELIRTHWGYDVSDLNWNEIDIAEEIAKRNLANSESTRGWEQLDDDEKKKKKSNIKNELNAVLSSNLTKELLTELGAYEEIESWFQKIKEFLN